MFCRHCGKEIADDSHFCPICGAEVTGASSNQPEKKSESLKVRKSIMMAGGLIVIALGISAYFLSGQMKTGSSSEATEAEATVSSDIGMQSTEEAPEQEETIQEEDIAGEYILPESNVRIYTKEELENLSDEELRLARNEIYARHGRIFSSDDLKQYFESKSWYQPLYDKDMFEAQGGDSLLNPEEIANRDLIQTIENEKNAENIDYKGSYVLQGEEYVWVKNYYIKDNCLYIEGQYCDGVANPNAEIESDTILFYPIKEDVVIRMDNNTALHWQDCHTIEDVKTHIDNMIDWFDNTAVNIKLKGDYVTDWYGTWQYS